MRKQKNLYKLQVHKGYEREERRNKKKNFVDTHRGQVCSVEEHEEFLMPNLGQREFGHVVKCSSKFLI